MIIYGPPYIPRPSLGLAPLPREPVSAAIGLTAALSGGFAAAGVGYVAAFAAASAVGGALVTGAIGIGLSFASQAFIASQQPSGSGPIAQTSKRINAPDQKISTRQSAPPKRIPYGTVHMGGALFFEQVKPPYLYRGFLLSARQISGMRKLLIGTNEVSFERIPAGIILQPDAAPYRDRLLLSFRKGLPDQTIDPLLKRDFPNLDPSFRQRGIATAVVRYDYGTDWEHHQALWGVSGDPQTWFVLDGVGVYDPRDPTQDMDDETTWKFSNNASLCQADYLRQQYGGRLDPARIDWARIAKSANYDDELVACTDGTFIKRYTVDGMVTLNQQPYEVMQSMLTANRGTVVQSGGMTWVASSKPADRVLTVYDNILVGGIEFRNDKPKRDLVNTVQTRFIADEREYNLTDGPILVDDDALAADGEPLVATLDLSFTRDYRRVERLQKAYKDTARLGKTVAIPVDLRALSEASDEIVNGAVLLESALFPQANGVYKAHTVSFADNFTAINLDLSEYDPLIETDWDFEADEVDFTVAELDVS